MLSVSQEALKQMTQVFSNSETEQGFLLGCTAAWNALDHCCQLPAARSGKYFYEPFAAAANGIIQDWADHGICFCGFVHSHLVDKPSLSENDIDFAHRLFRAYPLPVLWFGIGVVRGSRVDYVFYSVTEQDGTPCILPAETANGNLTHKGKSEC